VNFAVQERNDAAGQGILEQHSSMWSGLGRGISSRPSGLLRVMLAPVVLGMGLVAWNAIRVELDGWSGGVLVMVAGAVAVLSAVVVAGAGAFDLAGRQVVPAWLHGLYRELPVVAVVADVALAAPLALSWSPSPSPSASAVLPFVALLAALPWVAVLTVRRAVRDRAHS
jgi:hypothetical protein